MNRWVTSVLATAIAVTLASAGGQTSTAAQSTCKELSASKCKAKTSCTYVKGYTTSTGASVKPYCRNAGRKKTAKGKTPTKRKASAATRTANSSRVSKNAKDTAVTREPPKRKRKKAAAKSRNKKR